MIFHQGTRYLRNTVTGVVFIHNDLLAQRPNIVAYNPPGTPTQAIPVTAGTPATTASASTADLKPLSDLSKADFNKLKGDQIKAYMAAMGVKPGKNYLKNKKALRPYFLAAIGE